MLLLTYLWNASPSVCEDTRQDLPSQLPPRCTGFAVHWELGSTEVPGTSAPQAVHSIPHTFPTPSMQGPGPGEADMNQTRSLPTEGPQSAGGGNTHINYMDPGWLGYRYRGRRGWKGGRKGVISLSESGLRMKPKTGLRGAVQLVHLSWLLLCWEGLRRLSRIPPPMLASSSLPEPLSYPLSCLGVGCSL